MWNQILALITQKYIMHATTSETLHNYNWYGKIKLDYNRALELQSEWKFEQKLKNTCFLLNEWATPLVRVEIVWIVAKWIFFLYLE